ncbi:MAG: hypothetical protein OSJ27_04025 [Candidatus Gastranaerophilales bacterium]|nr:hypothetical protein [Candidatus Gastranaerophilales bacterium]
MIDEKLKYYKGIEQDYDLDKLNTKSIELFEIVNKYQFYGKRVKGIYLKILYKLGYLIALYLAKKESVSALKNKNKV